MRLKEVLAGLPAVRLMGSEECEILDIAYASQAVRPGSLFAALKGVHADGYDFIPEALDNGAAAVLSERAQSPACHVPWIQVEDAREALALCAANFFHHPSRSLKVLGITGTKGKTTVAYLLESILKAAGFHPGLLGTISYRGPGLSASASRTTPEAPDLQRMMRILVDNGASHCVMEVSSHALHLKRPVGTDFDVTVFTNLSGDHLDYHATMEEYFQAKSRLFVLGPRNAAVVNTDDPWGKKLISRLSIGGTTYGINPPAMVRSEDYRFRVDGIRATVRSPAGRFPLESVLLGKPNLYNILAASAAALTLNIPVPSIQQGVISLQGVPGRFEKIANTRGLHIFVDYAHTDDALHNLLTTARELSRERVIVVFGAGGDRDRSKRPRMGAAAGALADWTIVTSDNPRTENPEAIMAEIVEGIRQTGRDNFEVEADRRTAIKKALNKARKGDYILIAGKGHEDYQILNDRVIHFDDAEVIRELLRDMDQG
jgi:UDP-N-acetylmuramoyl-L-alanyl-D-glutamate--2,6-diaminopimelate ligase